MKLRNVVQGVLFLLLAAIAALSQGLQTGGVTGVVRDPSGAVIAGAKIDLVNTGTGKVDRSITSAADGGFAFTLVPPGAYRVDVSASGFKQFRAHEVEVRINEATRVDCTLEVGSIQDTISVEAMSTMVSTESATTGQPIDSHTLTALPLPVPNFLFLLTLSPGTAGEPPDVRSANRGIVDINVNGQRTSNNSVSIDGINVNDLNLAHFDTVPLPNPDAIEEFKVATSLYDASLGSKGGGALTLVLKSGTGKWHGDAYWSHRNDFLNANEWFRNQARVARPKLLQNVVGFSGSGPIPKLGGYWFANVQGVRARNGIDPNGSTVSPTIPNFPTAADGSTSAALLASAYGLNPSQIDPIAVNFLNLKGSIYGGNYVVPRAAQSGCIAPSSAAAVSFRCTFSKVAPISDNQFTITHDRSLRDGKDKISGRWFYDDGQTDKPLGTATNSGLAFPLAAVQRNRFASITETHLISPRQVNEFRFGFSRFNSSTAPTDLINLKDIGATRPNISQFPGVYHINVSGLFQFGTGVNDDRGTISNQFQWSDSWSLTRGRHTLRAGYEFLRYQLNRFNNFSVRGDLTFNATTGDNNTFTPFQNFLQGRVTGLQSAFGDPGRYFRNNDMDAYFQDDFRVSSRLSLNLGVRWEGMGFAHDKFYRSTIFNPALMELNPPQNPFVFASDLTLGGLKGTPGYGRCGLKTCFADLNFAPRAGFAWDTMGNQKLVVRGGFGIYYQRLSNQNLLQGGLGAPFTVQPISNDPAPVSFQLANPLAGQSGVSSGPIVTSAIPQVARFAGLRRISGAGPLDVNDPNVGPIFVNQDGQMCLNYGGTAGNCVINLASFSTALPYARTPYNQQWNLTIQRQFARSWAAEIGYVGSHYLRGIGIWDPYLASLASPSRPITVTDLSGQKYTITANTVNNRDLREGIIGLSRTRGARYDDNIGTAVYHSLQATLSHRFSRGLFFQAGYTFSREIDNVSGSQSTDELNSTQAGQNGASIYNWQNNPRQNRAQGDFNRPHRFVVSYDYELPFSANSSAGRLLVKGWSVSGIVSYQNGLPFSITDSSSNGAFGGGTGTGMLICRPASEQIAAAPSCTPGSITTIPAALTSGSIQSRLNNYINPNFFSAAPSVPNAAGAGATGYGNVPRNSFRGPFQQDWDFSVGKLFRVKERHSLNFRADFFNLFNHPIFRQPNTVSLNTPATFGQITSTVIPARLIQFGLRYQF